MTTTVQDKILSTGGPFIRLVQPERPVSPYAESSYFRLGSYVALNQEEAALVTGLRTTRSRVAPGKATSVPHTVTFGSVSQPVSATDQVCQDHRAEAGPPIASTNDGILIYTDHDLNETIMGAALQKFGKGHVVEVVEGDAAYRVEDGKYDLFAQNGIFLHAGTKAQPANIEIVAESHFKQIGFGDFLQKTGGNSRKETVGTSYETFIGAKFSMNISAEASIKLAGTLTITGGVEVAIRTAGKVSFTLAFERNLTIGQTTNVFIGSKQDMVIGVDGKVVKGRSYKVVLGSDKKLTATDFKFASVRDAKIVTGSDVKFVETNATICDIDYKKEFASAEESELKAKKGEITSKYNALVANKTKTADLTDALLKIYL